MAVKKTRLKNETQRKVHKAAYNKGYASARRHFEKKIEEILRAQQEVSGNTEINAEGATTGRFESRLVDIALPSELAAASEETPVEILMRRLRHGKVTITFDTY